MRRPRQWRTSRRGGTAGSRRSSPSPKPRPPWRDQSRKTGSNAIGRSASAVGRSMRCRAKLGRLSRRGRRYAHAVAGNRIPFLCCADRLASASPSWATRSSFRFYRTGITAAYVDFDQIGLCYPQPSDDPEVLILAQLAKPYSRATATCAAASVVRSETAAIRPAAALSPDLAARSKSLARRRKCPRSGRGGRVAMTSPSPAGGPRGGPIRSRHDLPSVKPEVDNVLPADPGGVLQRPRAHDTVRDHAVVVARVQRVVATLLAAGGFARRAARLPGKRAGRGAPRAGRGRLGPGAGSCAEGVEGTRGQSPPRGARAT